MPNSIGVKRCVKGSLEAKRDGIRIKSSAELSALVPLQLVDSNSFDLVDGSPSARRKFLDWGVFHVEHLYSEAWRSFQKALKQRNYALKYESGANLTVWNNELSRLNKIVTDFRETYLLDFVSFLQSAFNRYEPLKDIEIISTGNGYPEVPGITTVTSDTGSGAILEATSKTIGRVNKSIIENIGFDYPTDKTLRPEVAFPQILKIEALSGFESVGVTSLGRGYNTAPSLVVIDNRTKKQITDVDLKYHLDVSSAHVEILENTNSLFNTTPTILPVGNPNGIRMKDFSYDTDTQVVTATYKNPVSRVEDFVLEVGDRIMVENVAVGLGSTGSGYNSKNYDYNLFTITGVTTNLSLIHI